MQQWQVSPVPEYIYSNSQANQPPQDMHPHYASEMSRRPDHFYGAPQHPPPPHQQHQPVQSVQHPPMSMPQPPVQQTQQQPPHAVPTSHQQPQPQQPQQPQQPHHQQHQPHHPHQPAHQQPHPQTHAGPHAQQQPPQQPQQQAHHPSAPQPTTQSVPRGRKRAAPTPTPAATSLPTPAPVTSAPPASAGPVSNTPAVPNQAASAAPAATVTVTNPVQATLTDGKDNAAPAPPPPKKSRTNTPWTPQEEQRLKQMRDAGNSWAEIAKTFPTRTEGSVKKHWYKDMHYAEFAEDESQALMNAIKEYENNKWKVIGQKVGKPAKACEQYAKEHFPDLFTTPKVR